MANKIVLKKSSVTGRVPSTSDLDYGELALNYSDGKLYFKNSSNVINAFKVNNDLSTVLDRRLYTVSSAGTNTFAVDYEVGFVDVYVNGVKLNSSEFTATDGLNVTITALVIGDEVQLNGFRSFTYGDISTRYIRQTYTATEGQTTFNIEYSRTSGIAYVQVFVNGVLLDTAEYTATSGTSIVLTTAASVGDIVECIGLNDFQIFDLLTSGTGLSYDNNTGTISLNSATTATASTIALRDGSGNLTANNLYSTKIGVGTTTPDRTLHVLSPNGDQGIAAFEAQYSGLVVQDNSGANGNIEVVGYKQTGSSYHNILLRGQTGGLLIKSDGTGYGFGTLTPSAFLDIAGNTNVTGNITLTGELRGPESFVIDPAAVGDNTGTVVIKGNLQVDGTTTTINSTTLTVDDKNIVLASGAANAAAADGAGITIDGASASLTYSSSADRFETNKPLKVTGAISAGSTNSTGGSVIIGDIYSDGNITNLGSMYSSGGPYLSYGVKASNSSIGFVSSSGVAGLGRGAYYIHPTEHRWYMASEQTVAVGDPVSMSQKMVLKSTGYLGVGTPSPAYKFAVSDEGARGIELDPIGGLIQTYNRSTSAYYTMNLYASDIYLRTGSTPATTMLVGSNGTVKIGTTDAISSSSERLTVLGGSSQAATLANTSDTAATLYIRNKSTTSNTIQPVVYYSDNDGANRAGTGITYTTAVRSEFAQGGFDLYTGAAGFSNKRLSVGSSGIDVFGGVAISGTTVIDSGRSLTNIASLNLTRYAASVAGAGWYRVATISGANGRGNFDVTLYTVGGSYAPTSTRIRGFKDWSNQGAITSVESTTGVFSAYWSKYRITYNGSTQSWLEVYFTTAVEFTLYSDNTGYSNTGVLTGALSAGGDTVISSIDGTYSTFVSHYVKSNDRLVAAQAGIWLAAAGDASGYDDVSLSYTGYNSGSPQIIVQPRTTPGSGALTTLMHLKNSNGSSSNNNLMSFKVDGSIEFGSYGDVGRLFRQPGSTGDTVNIKAHGTAGQYFRVMSDGYGIGIADSEWTHTLVMRNLGPSNGQRSEIYNNGGHVLCLQPPVTTSSALVSIGNTSAVAKLDIALSPTTNAGTALSDFPANSRVLLTDYTDNSTTGSKVFFGAGFSSNGEGLNAGMSFIRENAGNWGTAIAFHTHPTATTNENQLVEALRITSGGKIGIGTSFPVAKLHVLGDDGDPASSGTAQTAILRLDAGSTEGWGESLDFGYHIGVTGPATYAWIQATNKSNLGLQYNIALNPLGGNVSVGGSGTATARLAVYGGTENQTSDATFLVSCYSSNDWGIILDKGTSSDYGLDIRVASAAAYGLRVGELRIDGDGDLYTAKTVRASALYHGTYNYWKTRDNGGASEWVLEYSTSEALSDANIKFRVYSNGNALLAGTFTEASTRRIKKNIRPITGALDVVNKLQGVLYDKIDGTAENEPGLIAEDTDEVLNNLVVYDDEGKPAGVKYTKTVAYLIEAVKELTAKVNALEAK